MTDTTQLRREFEAWFSGPGFPPPVRNFDSYKTMTAHVSWTAYKAATERATQVERERCAVICDELEEYWSAYKDTALLNGDIELSNVASGEPRAAIAIAAAIRQGDDT